MSVSYLMLQNVPILKFDMSTESYDVIEPDLMPFYIRGVFDNVPSNGVDFSFENDPNLKFLHFLAQRMLSLDRSNAKKLLNAYNFPQSQDDVTKAKIAITCKAISMSDDYWLNDGDMTFRWEDICPRYNHLNAIVSSIALAGSSFTLSGCPRTPELTGQGLYAKAWVRESDGSIWLYKAGSGKQEEEIEVLVSNLLDCSNVEHIRYLSAIYDYDNANIPVSKCMLANGDKYSLVPALDVELYCNRQALNFQDFVLSIDSDRFYQTCVIDYLIANSDRHMGNWGFYMDNATGKLERLYPIFDHNNAFDVAFMKDTNGGPSLMMRGKSQREAAEYALTHCDILFRGIPDDIFLNESQMECFLSRAQHLGIKIELSKQKHLIRR